MNERQDKQARFSAGAQTSKLRNRLLFGVILFLAAGTLGWGLSRGGSDSAPTIAARGGVVSLPLAEVDDGGAHFYRYQSGDKTVRFFVVRGNDGRLRAALDTCDVCYEAKKGYRQDGAEMVCNNCDQRFPTVKINEVSGGCNPVGLPLETAGERLTISAAALAQGARFF